MSRSVSGTASIPARAIMRVIPKPKLPHGRHDEAGIARALGPSRGHRLQPRVEAHTIRAVLVRVPEDRALPAAEAVIGEGHGNGHIDHDHADIQARGVLAPNI